MKQALPVIPLGRIAGLAAILLCSGLSAHAQKFTTYDITVPVTTTNLQTVIDGTGRILPSDRSFVIGIDGGDRGPVLIQNFAATAEFPLIITNHAGTGRVHITDSGSTTKRDAILIQNCQHFQVRGDNDPLYRYGFELGPVGSTGLGDKSGVKIGLGSSYSEVMFVEIHNCNFAGIAAKTDRSCSTPQYNFGNFTQRDTIVHDNYIHDTLGEGMYIGYTHWGEPLTCGSTTVYGNELRGVRINYNLVERAGWDSIQVASAPEDVKVHDNVMYYGGYGQTANQSSNLAIGGGSTGEYFNNIIIRCTQNGNNVSVIGPFKDISIYNNLLADGVGGIYTREGPLPWPANPTPGSPEEYFRTQPGGFINIFNNTIINPTLFAYQTADQVSTNSFKNNIVVAPNTAYDYITLADNATVTQAGNVMQRDYTGLSFLSPTEYDFRIGTSSTAVDAGVSLAGLSSPQVSVTTDFQGISRPQGTAYDAGLHETGPLSVYLIATPPTTTGGTGTVKASATGGTAPYTYLWSTGGTASSVMGGQGLYQVTVTDSTGAKVTKATYMIDLATMGAPVRVPANNEVVAPTFSPAPGSYSQGQVVTISSTTSGVTIRYTTDGSTPTSTSGMIYSGQAIIGGTHVLKAIAYKTGWVASEVTVGQYVITGPADSKFTVPATSITESTHVSSNTKDLTVDGDTATFWRADTPVHYTGSWTYGTLTGAYLGDVHTSATTDDSFIFDYSGGSGGSPIQWYGPVGPAYGQAAVSIDGGPETIVDCYSATDSPSVLLYTSGNLTSGHTLKVRVAGTKNASSTGYTVGADKFVVSTTTSNDNKDTQWIAYDLGANQRVGFVKMATASSNNRNYFFSLQGSTDGVNWTSVLPDWSSGQNTVASGPQAIDFPDIDPVRYLRFVGTGNNDGNRGNRPLNAYSEIEIWGGASGSANPRGIYQAENATLSGAVVRTNQPGYTGTGFADYINNTGDYVEWTVNNPNGAQTLGLTFRFAASSPRTLSISVNGTVVNSAVTFPSTGGSGTWEERTMLLTTIPSGTVTIRATAVSNSGPNMDYLKIE